MVLLVFNSSLENRLEENQKKKKKNMRLEAMKQLSSPGGQW